jgi:hypothetical protein
VTVNAHAFPSFIELMAKGTSPLINWSTDTFKVALIASTGANSLGGNGNNGALNSTVEAMNTWASILANGSSALTEVSGTGYTTGGASIAMSAPSQSGAVVTVAASVASVSWSTATFSAYQAVFYDASFNSNAGQGICYWDFGGVQSCSNGTFTLNLGSGNALVQFTAS